jgi:hypothetical protein
MVSVVLLVLAGWLLLSVLGTVVFATLARGGQHEDQLREDHPGEDCRRGLVLEEI